VDKAERDAIMRQQVVLPETPRQRRERAALEEDLRSMPIAGHPLPLRLRNFRASAEAYLASMGGPRAYMLRLRAIETAIREHELELDEAWRALAHECGEDQGRFASRWTALAASWSFDEVNELIERHNRWYPTESQLPMDPRTGDFTLVNGRDYRREPLDARWILERYPPTLTLEPVVAP
jgi:hypothetical protein